MSAEGVFSTADFRNITLVPKRDVEHKQKWALGATGRIGRPEGNVRPRRPSETDYCIKNRQAKAAVAAHSPGVKIARKHDMLEGANRFDESSADDTSDEYDESTSAPFPGDTTVMYSFDAPSGPTRDTEILNVALAKAVQRFEERETVSLVKNEYDVLDSEGEVVAMSPVKKGKGASGKADSRPVMISDADEDYEFV